MADNKILVRLKDTSTTFYDGTQDVSVVADRLARVVPTAKVMEAISKGILIQDETPEAKQRYKAQQIDLMDRGLIPDTRKEKQTAAVETEEEATGDEGVEQEEETAPKTTSGKGSSSKK